MWSLSTIGVWLLCSLVIVQSAPPKFSTPTTSQLATFYAKYGKDSININTRDALEATLYGQDEFFHGDISAAKARVDAIFSKFVQGTPSSYLKNAGGDIEIGRLGYSALRMLKQVLDFAATKKITYAQSALKAPFTLVVAVTECGVGERALNLALTKKEKISIKIDPRLSINNYAGIRSSLKLFQAYLWAITEGAFTVNVVVKKIFTCATLACTKTGDQYIMRASTGYIYNDEMKAKTKEADMVLWIYPSNRPTSEVFKGTTIITGGAISRVGPLFIMAHDFKFVEKAPYTEDGTWTDVERRMYLPQWIQHEVFHNFFSNFKDAGAAFNLEPTSHSWFNPSKWPSDFKNTGDNLEADYYANAVNRRYIPMLKPGLGVRLLEGFKPSQAVLSHEDSPLDSPSSPPSLNWNNLAIGLTLLLACSTFLVVLFTWRIVSSRHRIEKA